MSSDVVMGIIAGIIIGAWIGVLLMAAIDTLYE